MKYQFMQQYGSGFAVVKMCQVFGVSRSGYYAYLRRGFSPRYEENQRLVRMIKDIWQKFRRVYGSPRITAELHAQGVRCGKNRIARLMRENGIKVCPKKGYKVTTQSNHSLPLAEDLVERDFSADSENQLWLSDITYLWTWEGWLYLAAIMDVYNREIIGWTLGKSLTKDLVVTALQNALIKRNPRSGLIFHSDRGSQYACLKVRNILNARGIRQSMSGKGNCYDNAMMESFFSSLKKELVHKETFHSTDKAKYFVYDYIEIFYNRQRRHSSLNYKTPVEYAMEVSQP
jgi:putative transposase